MDSHLDTFRTWKACDYWCEPVGAQVKSCYTSRIGQVSYVWLRYEKGGEWRVRFVEDDEGLNQTLEEDCSFEKFEYMMRELPEN